MGRLAAVLELPIGHELFHGEAGLTGLNQLADRLKQAQRESKTSEKESQSVRQTLRSLQGVRI